MLVKDEVDRYQSPLTYQVKKTSFELGQESEALLEHKMTDVEWWSYVDSCFTKAIQNYKEI